MSFRLSYDGLASRELVHMLAAVEQRLNVAHGMPMLAAFVDEANPAAAVTLPPCPDGEVRVGGKCVQPDSTPHGPYFLVALFVVAGFGGLLGSFLGFRYMFQVAIKNGSIKVSGRPE